MPPQGSFRQPWLGLKRNVCSQLQETRAKVRVRSAKVATQAERARLTESRVRDVGVPEIEWASARYRKVRVVEHIQSVRLECELHPLANGDGLRQRHVEVPNVRAVKPWINPKGSRRRVLADASNVAIAVGSRISRQQLRIDDGGVVGA